MLVQLSSLKDFYAYPLRELGHWSIGMIAPFPLALGYAVYRLTGNPIMGGVIVLSAYFLLVTILALGFNVGTTWLWGSTKQLLDSLSEVIDGTDETIGMVGSLIQRMDDALQRAGDGLDAGPFLAAAERMALVEEEVSYLKRAFEDFVHNNEQLRNTRGARRGMTKKRERRAHIFKQIKDANPHLSYAQVATRANLEYEFQLGKMVEEHDVRNDYIAMGWTWENPAKLR